MTMNALDLARRVTSLVELVQSDEPLEQASDIAADVWGRNRPALAEAFEKVWADDGRSLPERAARIRDWLVGIGTIP